MSQRDRDLLQNSIERMINSTITCLEHLLTHTKNQSIRELADTNLQDWIALKSTAVYIWGDARNEAFKRAQDSLRSPQA